MDTSGEGVRLLAEGVASGVAIPQASKQRIMIMKPTRPVEVPIDFHISSSERLRGVSVAQRPNGPELEVYP